MNILIFEDDFGRIDWFKSKLKGHTLRITESVPEAVCLMATEKFDLIFLDHDINRNMAFKGTGSELVCRLVELPSQLNHTTDIYIHSMNTVGASYMEAVLDENGFAYISKVPFSQLINLIRITNTETA